MEVLASTVLVYTNPLLYLCLCFHDANRYLSSHKTLLAELYDELDLAPCAALGLEPTPVHNLPSFVAASSIEQAARDAKADDKEK